MTEDYLLWKCSLPKFFLWYDRATEIKTGKLIHRDNSTKEDINDKFVKDKKTGKWIAKNVTTGR